MLGYYQIVSPCQNWWQLVSPFNQPVIWLTIQRSYTIILLLSGTAASVVCLFLSVRSVLCSTHFNSLANCFFYIYFPSTTLDGPGLRPTWRLDEMYLYLHWTYKHKRSSPICCSFSSLRPICRSVAHSLLLVVMQKGKLLPVQVYHSKNIPVKGTG